MLDFHTKHDRASPPHSALVYIYFINKNLKVITTQVVPFGWLLQPLWDCSDLPLPVTPFRAQTRHSACRITRCVWHLLQSSVVVVSVDPHQQRFSTERAMMLWWERVPARKQCTERVLVRAWPVLLYIACTVFEKSKTNRMLWVC